MTMISLLILWLAAALSLAAALLEGWAWRRAKDALPPVALRLAQGATALLAAGLVWRGVERLHVPPVGSGEMALAIAGLTLALYGRIRPRLATPSGAAGASLLFAALLAGGGAYLAGASGVGGGREAWWGAALAGRWLLAGGAAALLWLTILRLCGETAPENLPSAAAGAIGVAAPLLVVRGGWTGLDSTAQTLALSVLVLWLGAARWLQLGRPRRPRLEAGLLTLALLAALVAAGISA